jgi:hypothetical protein
MICSAPLPSSSRPPPRRPWVPATRGRRTRLVHRRNDIAQAQVQPLDQRRFGGHIRSRGDAQCQRQRPTNQRARIGGLPVAAQGTWPACRHALLAQLGRADRVVPRRRNKSGRGGARREGRHGWGRHQRCAGADPSRRRLRHRRRHRRGDGKRRRGADEPWGCRAPPCARCTRTCGGGWLQRGRLSVCRRRVVPTHHQPGGGGPGHVGSSQIVEANALLLKRTHRRAQ